MISSIPEETVYTSKTVLRCTGSPEGKQWIQGSTKPAPQTEASVLPVPRCIETRKLRDLRCHRVQTEKTKPIDKPVLDAGALECTSPRQVHDAYLKAIYNILDISLISRYERDETLSDKYNCAFDHTKLYTTWPEDFTPTDRTKVCWKLTTRDGVHSFLCDLCYTGIMFSPVWDTVSNPQSRFESGLGFRFTYPRLMHPSVLYRRARGGTAWPLRTLAKRVYMHSSEYDSLVDIVEMRRKELATKKQPFVSPRQCDKRGKDLRPSFVGARELVDIVSNFNIKFYDPCDNADSESDAETVCFYETHSSLPCSYTDKVKSYWEWCELIGLEYDAFSLLPPPWESELTIGTFGDTNNFIHVAYGKFTLDQRGVLSSIKKKRGGYTQEMVIPGDIMNGLMFDKSTVFEQWAVAVEEATAECEKSVLNNELCKGCRWHTALETRRCTRDSHFLYLMNTSHTHPCVLNRNGSISPRANCPLHRDCISLNCWIPSSNLHCLHIFFTTVYTPIAHEYAVQEATTYLTLEHVVCRESCESVVSRIAFSRYEFECLSNKFHNLRQKYANALAHQISPQVLGTHTCKGDVRDGGYHYLNVGVPNGIGSLPNPLWDLSHCPEHVPPKSVSTNT